LNRLNYDLSKQRIYKLLIIIIEQLEDKKKEIDDLYRTIKASNAPRKLAEKVEVRAFIKILELFLETTSRNRIENY
jgi:hypothetical protein